MPGKRFWATAALLALLAGSGCCRLCDRWCGEHHAAPAGCVPCCPAPAPVCCPPGTTAASPVPVAAPNAGWQRTYPNACCQ